MPNRQQKPFGQVGDLNMLGPPVFGLGTPTRLSAQFERDSPPRLGQIRTLDHEDETTQSDRAGESESELARDTGRRLRENTQEHPRLILDLHQSDGKAFDDVPAVVEGRKIGGGSGAR